MVVVGGTEAGVAGRLTGGAEDTGAGLAAVTDTVEAGWLEERRARRA